MEKKRYKRKKYLIKKGFQFRYMGVILLTMLFLSMVVGWTIYFNIWSKLATGELKSAADLSLIFNVVNRDLLWRIPILVVLIAISTIFISHRIAGPIYRFEQSAKRISEGDLTLRIKLRRGDELQELANCFNVMTEKLENLVLSDRRAINNIIRVIKELPDDLKGETLSKDKRDEIVEKLLKTVDELQKITRNFKIKEDINKVN